MSESSPSPPPESPPAAEPDDADAPAFEPARLRRRFDGWTPERQVGFIEALAETACVADACRAVGLSERSAYALRARADAVSFRNAWDTALDFAVRRLSDAVLSRAINGVARPVFFQGEQVGERRYFDERLAMFVLRYRDPLRYGKWLDRREHAGHPEGAALELAAAKRAVGEDGDLSADEVADRIDRRLDEIARRIALADSGRREDDAAEEAPETPAKGQNEGDVA